MKDYLKGSLKVLADYGISLLIFVIFVLSLYKHLFIYSVIIFLLMFSIIYSDMRRLAIREKRPQYNIPHYPLKGLVYGIIGFLPVVILAIIIPFLPINTNMVDVERIKHVAVNTLLSPLFWVVKLGGEQLYAYAISCLVVPLISMLGYISGLHGFEIRTFFKKNNQQKKKV